MMTLNVITPEKQLYSGEIVLIQLPGTMGSFQILNNHAPLIADLEAGKLKIIDEQRNKFFLEIQEGIVEVKNNRITVLTK